MKIEAQVANETNVPELVTADELEVARMNSDQKTSSAFFKSYDATHEHTHETASDIKSGAPAVHPPSPIAKAASTLESVPTPVAEPEAAPQKEFTVEQNEASLVNHVSDTLASMDETSDDVEVQDDSHLMKESLSLMLMS
ncbi:MAG: hypothetical protein QNL01_14030 [Akkermansiaceae bacterium]